MQRLVHHPNHGIYVSQNRKCSFRKNFMWKYLILHLWKYDIFCLYILFLTQMEYTCKTVRSQMSRAWAKKWKIPGDFISEQFPRIWGGWSCKGVFRTPSNISKRLKWAYSKSFEHAHLDPLKYLRFVKITVKLGRRNFTNIPPVFHVKKMWSFPRRFIVEYTRRVFREFSSICFCRCLFLCCRIFLMLLFYTSQWKQYDSQKIYLFKECPACHGKGKRPCAHCNGSGGVSGFKFDLP